MSVREPIARERILGAITRRLTSPEGIAYARKRIVERLREVSKLANAELMERRQRLARTDQRIRGLVDCIAAGDRSDAVVSGLRDLEAQGRSERDAIARIEQDAAKPIELPNIDKIVGRVFDLEVRARRREGSTTSASQQPASSQPGWGTYSCAFGRRPGRCFHHRCSRSCRC